MSEEMMTFDEIENNQEVAVYEDSETSGGGCIGKILLVLAGAGAAAAVVWHKTKDKREAKKIEKLKKKGYVIYAPDEVVDDEEPTSCDDAE